MGKVFGLVWVWFLISGSWGIAEETRSEKTRPKASQLENCSNPIHEKAQFFDRSKKQAKVEFTEDGIAYVRCATAKKMADNEGYEKEWHDVLFSGVNVVKRDSSQIEFTYQKGKLDGPVTISINEKMIARFQVEQGRVVTNSLLSGDEKLQKSIDNRQ